MTPLNKKLLRDMWHIRGQVLAIALVIASGVGVLIMSLGTETALRHMADAYYERYRFAHVFADVKRAPDFVKQRIAEIDGVQAVETRIQQFAMLDMPGVDEPVIGKLVSIDEKGGARLNKLALVRGRLVGPNQADEVVVNEPFAVAHGLNLGDRFGAVINGNLRALQVVGIALSPEFIYAIAPGGLMPDDFRFGILWMGKASLSAAYGFNGAFNNVVLALRHGSQIDTVLHHLDRLLLPYGAMKAYARKDQQSNWFLTNELAQLRSLAVIMPTIFYVVVAFLFHMVMSRLIATEREEIGLLKAFGYSNGAIGWHYLKLVIVITMIGMAMGAVMGYGMGRLMTHMYAEFFHFPFVFDQPAPRAFVLAFVISLLVALMAVVGAVRKAVQLPPAESMRPPAPVLFRRALAGTRIAAAIDQPTRIILRQIIRWPVRALLSAFGIALSIGLLISAMQWLDALDYMVEVYFERGQHQDATLGLAEVGSTDVLRDVAHLPGVRMVEPMRAVSARLTSARGSRREGIIGVVPDPALSPVYDSDHGVVPIPPAGLVMSTMLAELLHVGIGDEVEIEVLEGRRPVLRQPVVALFDTLIASPVYMHIDALNNIMKEGRVLNTVHIRIDRAQEGAFFAKLKELPRVSAVTLKRKAIEVFQQTIGENMYINTSFFILFSCFLIVGVMYNLARISLSERGRELGTLRVLGFGRGEVSYILLGESALILFVGLPVGAWAGYGLAWMMVGMFKTEMFRIPLHIEHSTYGWAVVFGILAALLAMGLVRRSVERLDLMAVLKSRE